MVSKYLLPVALSAVGTIIGIMLAPKVAALVNKA